MSRVLGDEHFKRMSRVTIGESIGQNVQPFTDNDDVPNCGKKLSSVIKHIQAKKINTLTVYETKASLWFPAI